jgi:hypothetical protein
VTGPYTVVDAIAAGQRAAASIDRYLQGAESAKLPVSRLPEVFIEPPVFDDEEQGELTRAEPPTLPIVLRNKSFAEVEGVLSIQDATREARRCLRCDLEFTRRKHNSVDCGAAEGTPA